MKPTTILVAVRPEPLPMVLSALEGYELVVVRNMEDAVNAIQKFEIDLFVIGILFDDSSGMELIKGIRLGDRHKSTPVFVTRFMPSQHEQMLRAVMDTMVALGTVSEYLESDYKADGIEAIVRRRVESYLPAEKRLDRSGHHSSITW